MLQSSTYGHAARAAFLATCLATTAQAATPGEVDPTFGTNGRTVVADNSKAIGLRLPDGSLLVASHITGTVVDLRRFDSDGHPDLRFGVAGVARHEFADSTDLMQSVARAPDGRVYFGGWTRNVRNESGYLDAAVFAVDAQGAAVTTFGNGGLVSYDLPNPLNSGFTDNARALAVMPDGRLLVAGYSGDFYYEWDDAYDRLPQLLRFNADGSLDRKVDLGQVTYVCSGIVGLHLRADGSLLVGDDTGIHALLDDAALHTFGVDGTAGDEYWSSHSQICTGMRGFAADDVGELLRISEVVMNDDQLGFVLDRLHDNGTRIEPSVQAPPVPLAKLVGDARFARLPIDSIAVSRPIYSAADERVYVLFGFGWGDSASGNDFGSGWAIARFAKDATLDTGWGEGGLVVLEKGSGGYRDTVPTLLEPLPDGRIVAMSANGVLTRLFGGQREGHGAINIDAGRILVEGAGQVSIKVTRTGGSAGAVSVEYSTIEFDAKEGEDFTAVSGRLDWADGDTSPREIVIPILEDTLKESDQRFVVDIRSPLGGAVLLNTRALLAINDDDSSTPPPPPPPTTTTPPSASSGGGGATDGLTLILLISLIALGVAERRRKAEGRWWLGASMRLIHASLSAASLATASLPVSQADTYQPVAATTQEAPQRVIHVDDDSTLGGNGSTRFPYNNLADALADARTTSAAVVIDVAPGRYVIDSTLVIDRSLVLRGSSVMSEGTHGLPTGGIVAGTATRIVGSEALGPAPLVAVGRSDGVVIKKVTIRGFVFKGAADYFGTELNFTRVQGLVVAGNVFRAPARFGIETIASSGRVDENHFSRLQTGAVFTGGYPASPSKVTFRGNRSVRNDLGGVLLSGASISIPELGDQLDATVRDNDLSDNGAFGVRLFIVRRDLGAPGDSQSTGHINALLRGNRIARNVTGVLIDAGFPFRQVDDTCDPRLYSGTIDLRLEDNTVSGSLDVASWITFTRWPGAQDPESLASWQYLHAAVFTITDRQRVLGDIAIDHPERDPLVGPCPGDQMDEPLDNVLRYNGVVLPNGRNY